MSKITNNGLARSGTGAL